MSQILPSIEILNVAIVDNIYSNTLSYGRTKLLVHRNDEGECKGPSIRETQFVKSASAPPHYYLGIHHRHNQNSNTTQLSLT